MFGFFSNVFNTFPIRHQILKPLIYRTRVRYHFPRPNEIKRVVHQGYFARLRTLPGRRLLMRRILRGRHVLGH